MTKATVSGRNTSKQRIFEAAKAIFDKQGADGLSIRKIAGEVGLTPMAIYRHYASKDELLDVLMLDGFAVWEAKVAAIRTRDPMRWLERLGEAFMDFALNEPHRYEAAFLLPADHARRYPDDFIGGHSPVVAMIDKRIDDAKSKGLVADTPTFDISLTFAALAQGLITMYRAGRFTNEEEFRSIYRRSLRDCLQRLTVAGQAT